MDEINKYDKWPVNSVLEIRDLARTDLAPVSMNMTENEWAKYRIRRIAGMANALADALENPDERAPTLPPGQQTNLYRTVYTIEILSDQRVIGWPLATIIHEMYHGDVSGRYSYSEIQVSREFMRQLLIDQGSDPEFLLGEDEEE